MTASLKIGTRRSALATAQTGLIAAALRERFGVETELVEITTEGDLSQRAQTPLAGGSSVGVFVSALRDALLAGEVDIAVHSLKDLPTYRAEGIALVATPAREDPRDVLIARDGLTLGELPPGSIVGTGSLRRGAQLKALGLGVEVRGLRGNVGTRIDYVRSGKYDAVVLARAGLSRLGRLDEATEMLDPIQMLPAPGQGALGLECRAEDTETAALLAGLDDPLTRAAISAERAALATLEGGCSAPIGALAEIAEGDEGSEIWLRVVVLSADGTLSVRRSATAALDEDPATWPASAAELGDGLATEMLAEGAAELMSDPALGSAPTPSTPVPGATNHPSARSAEVQHP
ncbi:MAG: hydroxymethylbilane synthase [Nocardioidaceae bacterium]|nr:hydroxymethylbilane synthase [Nocardioidaceae bacterium]